MIMKINYLYFILEASKITLYCLLITAIFFFLGTSQATLLVMFNIAVMSAATTFSVEKKQLSNVFFGSIVILISIVVGGILGFYAPFIAKCLTIIYATCAFSIPKTKLWLNILKNGAVMFLIFSFLPFNLNSGIHYLFLGLLIVFSFTLFHWLFDRQLYPNKPFGKNLAHKQRFSAGILIAIALILAYLLAHFLQAKVTLQHIYWIPFTTLVIAQGVQFSTITTALKRIIVNTLGALFIIFLFTYVISDEFWVNFSMLVIFLFCIFLLGFSYIGRTFFIELFVLGYTHLLGQYHNLFAYDRIVMTFLGGLIVIIVAVGFLSFIRVYRKWLL